MRVVVVVVAVAGVEVIRVKDKGRNGLTVNVDTECNRMSGERGRVQRKKGVCVGAVVAPHQLCGF